MNSWSSTSASTWDAAKVGPPLSVVREDRIAYDVHMRSPLDYMRLLPILIQGTTSADVRFSLGETNAPLWGASVLDVLLSSGEFYCLPLMIRPRTAQERGPFGGRLISLAEACRLADEALLTAERERQAARERDALYWSDLEDEP